MSVNKELAELKNDFIALKTEVSGWMSTTTEYRKSLCGKMDVMMEKITELPCRERKGIYDSLSKQVKWIWVICSAVMIGIIGDWLNKR